MIRVVANLFHLLFQNRHSQRLIEKNREIETTNQTISASLSGRFYPLSSPETLEVWLNPSKLDRSHSPNFEKLAGNHDVLGLNKASPWCMDVFFSRRGHPGSAVFHCILQPSATTATAYLPWFSYFFWGRSSPESTIFFGGVNNPWR